MLNAKCGVSGLEGRRAISAAEMFEELYFASRRTVFDEFLREEIGCCPKEDNGYYLLLLGIHCRCSTLQGESGCLVLERFTVCFLKSP